MAERNEIVDHLFTQAIHLTGQQRNEFLKLHAASQPSVLAEVLEMLRNFDRVSGFLDGPLQLVPPGPLLRNGWELAGRFRVDNFIARGGMGEVYEAFDLLLGEAVAIKTIGSFTHREDQLIDQFREEIKLGRKVGHRYVCRIHDIYEHSLESGKQLLFFAMELLQGETLATRIARDGALPISVALPIVKQILEGIGEAHARGIVHRDLKPGNVMLTPDRVVITDFGLAQIRLDSVSPELAPPEVIAGSLPYMAPEQFTQSHVGPAADIFSLGVLMYEMVTGELPFPVSPLSAAVESRLTGTFTPTRLWQHPISLCLAADPKRRPVDVQAVLRLISPRLGRRFLIGGGTLTLAGAAFGIWRTQIQPGVGAGLPILLVDTQEAATQKPYPVVDQLLRTQLGQSAYFEVLTRGRIQQIQEQMARPAALPSDRRTIREIALRAGAPLVVYATVIRNKNLTLEVEIEKLGSHQYFALGAWRRSFAAASDSELRTAASDAALWIRQSIGEHADELARRNRRPEEATTGSWEGLLEYVEAETARSKGDDVEAIRRLTQALELDSEFPLARMRLADILLGMGRSDEAYSHWTRAASLVENRHLTDRESFRIRTLFFADTYQHARAEQSAENWAANFPNDYLPLFYLASSQIRQGHRAEALNSYNKAYSKAPGNQFVVLNRAQAFLEQGDFARAKAGFDSVPRVSAWWWQYMAEYWFLSGDIRAAWDSLDQLGRLDQVSASRSLSLKACLLFECGQPAAALKFLWQGIAFDNSIDRLKPLLPRKLLLLANAELLYGARRAALEAARTALNASSQTSTLLQVASVLWQADSRDEATKLVRTTQSAPDYPVFRALKVRFQALTLQDTSPAGAATLFAAARQIVPVENPGHELAHAFELVQDFVAANEIWSDLAAYPARYCLEPDRRRPGVYRAALTVLAKSDSAAVQRLSILDAGGRTLI